MNLNLKKKREKLVLSSGPARFSLPHPRPDRTAYSFPLPAVDAVKVVHLHN
jgi:hypothetical protein